MTSVLRQPSNFGSLHPGFDYARVKPPAKSSEGLDNFSRLSSNAATLGIKHQLVRKAAMNQVSCYFRLDDVDDETAPLYSVLCIQKCSYT